MKKKPKSGRDIGRRLRAVLAVLIGFTLIGVPTAYEAGRWLQSPFSIVGFSVCGWPQGAVVTLRNGKQVFYKATDPKLLDELKKVPDERKGRVSTGGAYCNPKQQVY